MVLLLTPNNYLGALCPHCPEAADQLRQCISLSASVCSWPGFVDCRAHAWSLLPTGQTKLEPQVTAHRCEYGEGQVGIVHCRTVTYFGKAELGAPGEAGSRG